MERDGAGKVAVASKTVVNLVDVKGVKIREQMEVGVFLGGGAVIMLKTRLL